MRADRLRGWCLSIILILNILPALTGCSMTGTGSSDNRIYKDMKLSGAATGTLPTAEEAAAISDDLVYVGRDTNEYATGYCVDRYEDGSRLLSIANGDRYLATKADTTLLKDIPEDIIVLKDPVEDIYLVSTATMDYFAALDSLGHVAYTSLKASDWTVPEAVEALDRGDMVYAGKYSAPDYELLASGGCRLAIENTMIYHSPEVMDKLHAIGTDTLVEYSSYEEHPLGRMEWIRFFGALTGEDERAYRIFADACRSLDELKTDNAGEKSVAFFYFTQSGTVNIRVSDDYVPKMIELAGGSYIFTDIRADGNKSSIDMTMEEFVSGAADADVIIYNSTIDGELYSIDELVRKNSLLAEFKAVRTGEVYCTTLSLYQRPMGCAGFIREINMLLNGEYTDKDGEFIYRLKQ